MLKRNAVRGWDQVCETDKNDRVKIPNRESMRVNGLEAMKIR